MNKSRFSWVALGIGGIVAMILLRFGVPGSQGEQVLPLLTSLFLAEFGFLITAAGSYMGYRAWSVQQGGVLSLLPPVGCVLLAVGFAWLGLAIWGEKIAA